MFNKLDGSGILSTPWRCSYEINSPFAKQAYIKQDVHFLYAKTPLVIPFFIPEFSSHLFKVKKEYFSMPPFNFVKFL